MDANTSQVITSIASTAGVVLVAWIAFQQAKLGKAVEEVRHQTNSLTEQLVTKTEIASKAEGVLQGKAEAAGAPPQP